MAADYTLPDGYSLRVSEPASEKFIWEIRRGGQVIATSDRDYSRFWVAKRGGERAWKTFRAKFAALLAAPPIAPARPLYEKLAPWLSGSSTRS